MISDIVNVNISGKRIYGNRSCNKAQFGMTMACCTKSVPIDNGETGPIELLKSLLYNLWMKVTLWRGIRPLPQLGSIWQSWLTNFNITGEVGDATDFQCGHIAKFLQEFRHYRWGNNIQ